MPKNTQRVEFPFAENINLKAEEGFLKLLLKFRFRRDQDFLFYILQLRIVFYILEDVFFISKKSVYPCLESGHVSTSASP